MLGLALGRKINESTVEGRQSSPAANRQGQQVRIGHLSVTPVILVTRSPTVLPE